MFLTSNELLESNQDEKRAYAQILSNSVRLFPLTYSSSIQSETSAPSGCTNKSSSLKVDGTPQQSDGGSFVDDMPNRSDLRTDTTSGIVEIGVPFRLIITCI